MGKKKSRRNNNQHNKAFIASPSPIQNPPVVEEDEIGEELAEIQREAENQPIAAPRKSLSALSLDYDEFDRADIEIPLNSGFDEPDRATLNAPKHAYQTVYMSHENVTSPVPRTPLNRTDSIHSNKSAFGMSSSNLRTARSGSVSSNYNKLTDGGAYEDFRSSHQSLNNEGSKPRNYAGGDTSFLSDATEERSLAGFPTSAFGGSRASIRKEEHSDDEIQIIREITRRGQNQLGELERLNIPETYERRSRLNSRNSGIFGFEDGMVSGFGQSHKDVKSPSRRSRTVSETSRQSGPSSSNRVLKNAASQQLTDEVPEDVRTYHADSEYLQNRLSKLSIHTNNDEFVLVGGHPPDFGGRSNIPSIRVNDDTTFRSDSSRTRENESVFSRLSESNRSKSMSRENMSSNARTVTNNYSSDRDLRQSEEILGRSISQNQFSDRSASVSRASSRHTIGTTSNTDDRLLLAAKYSRLPEAEGLVQIPNSQPTTSNVRTIVGTKPSLSRTSSICSNKSDRVNFAEIPTLFSHPDDNFGNNEDDEGESFRPTKEHQFTPSNKVGIKTSLREKIQALEDREPEKALFVTSALTPVSKRAPIPSKSSVSDSVLQTPQTIIRNQESRCIRQIVQPLTTKNTAEIAIQTGNTIRLRQGKWNPDVLSEFVDPVLPHSPNRPKMNNSFERNGHPAVSVLSNMLRNRVNSPKATPTSSDTDVTTARSSQSNSSHQVTMVHQSDSQNTVLNERLRHISDRYRSDENESKFVPLSTSTPSKSAEKQRRNGTSSMEFLQEQQALQKTGSEKSIQSMTESLTAVSKSKKKETGQVNIDARWVEEKRSNGDTIRKHVPRGRIRDLAQAFDTMQISSPKQELPVPNVRGNYWRAPEEYPKEPSPNYISGDRLHSSSDMRSRSSSNRLDGSTMSSNLFLPHSSSNNINDRHRSTSSSLSNQPNVFTRNTFVRTSTTATSNLKPGGLPTNVPMSTTPGSGQGDLNGNYFGGFVSQFERIPSNKNLADNKSKYRNMKHDDGVLEDPPIAEDLMKTFKGDTVFRRSMPNREPLGRHTGNTPILRRQTAVIEIPKNSEIGVNVPIKRVSSTNQGMNDPVTTGTTIEVPINRLGNSSKYSRPERAKTQEVNTAQYYQPTSHTVYETRAASGEIRKTPSKLEESFRTGRDLYGRQTTEDLSSIRNDGREMFEERRRKMREFEVEIEKTIGNEQEPRSRPLEVSPKLLRQPTAHFEKHPSKLNVPTNLTRHSTTTTITRDNIAYSPPATEDAGSRVTHLTQSLQDGSTDRILTAEEDSSTIRGKIDRMFDFVDENEKHRIGGGEETSTISSGTLGGRERSARLVNGRFEKNVGEPYSPNTKFTSYVPVSHQRVLDEHGEWERTVYTETRTNSEVRIPEASEKYRRRVVNTPPDRRNTVATGGGTTTDSDFEYSLSQYREMQREQLFRRLPSVDEPQFFRSPTLTAPHAGQSINAYRSKDLCGTPTAGEKIRLNPSFTGGFSSRVVPIALATSTPIDSPTSISSTYRKREVNNNTLGEHGLVEGIGGPHDTFVSSISGISTNDKQMDFMKRIDRLSYMIENTQKQISMNEAALADAIKKGKQHQEVAANRSILIGRETLRLQRRELRRLHAISAVRRPPPPVARNLKGSVIFSNITVHLNKNFCSRLTPADDNSYAFVALFKCDHQVEATEFLSLRVFHNVEIVDRLIFEKAIQFSDVPVDFTVSVEFYAMKVQPPKQAEHTSFTTRCKNWMGPPQKKTSNVVSSDSAFKMRGRIVLDRDASGERCFYLDDVTYPLEGTVMIHTKCSRLPDVFEEDFKGFLTMFSTISNMASWDRYWAVLRRGIVFLWKYPDEEQQGKEPRMQIDLTKCTNNSIEKCAFDVCPRPCSFMIEILVESAENQADQPTIGSVVEKKRVLLSADTDEMLLQWLCSMNQTLDVIRGPI